MKNIVFVLALIGASYYVYTNHSPFQTEATDPHFIEVRYRIDNTNIKLVGYGKMLSKGDCLTRSALFWHDVFKHAGKVDIADAETECNRSMPKRYRKLFEDKPITASYLVMNKGSNRERDARFIFYGVPSSLVIKECDKIIQTVKKNYRGKVRCVKGTIG